ncbi:RagB/SusD family nutrient uptake outer membrane protein [Echinicola soli]|uniref:RagB/SusD family nutrient uptake outer membrane protein n=1 Tax=Echinicola soli TaxID=2591634 RepID=A0A514CN33_9BACT|nr:RagB/SusD family nutrient uptake outer membrane protein [Echinicola soli]QDH81200.1 RagB/SusD family nutrient uptake outer membrane protein [Echinicola soli]
MKKIFYHLITVMIISIVHLLTACDSFLDEKPNTGLVVPDNLEDIQALFDNDYVMNRNADLGEIASDDYMITTAEWESWNETARNAHVWNEEIFPSGRSVAWNNLYQQVFYANVALEQLDKIRVDKDELQWNQIYGRALVYRASAFYNLLKIFTMPYHIAPEDFGIPIKLEADVNKLVGRASISQSYGQVLQDLENSIPYLPDKVPVTTRPSRQAAYGLLSRVYLTMGDYEKVLEYTGKALDLQAELMDYSTLNASGPFGFSGLNKEIIYCSYFSSGSVAYTSDAFIVPELYGEYGSGDLRKDLFFTSPNEEGLVKFKGTYMGNLYQFDGIATDELLLSRAEAAVRLGDDALALRCLNLLLEHRYEDGLFEEVSGLSGEELLGKILQERRKELVFRGLRWEDLRRLTGSSYEKTIVRQLGDLTYQLKPGDAKYAFPIPLDEIQLNGIPQNPR